MDRTKIPLIWSVLCAMLALLVGAGVLVAGFAVYTESQVQPGANTEHEKVILGSSLQAIAGTATPRGESLEITAYELRSPDHRAIAVSKVRLQAANYPRVSYAIDAQYPGPALRLVWRTTAKPSALYAVALNRTDLGESVLNMADHPQWRGTLIEVGVYGTTRDPTQTFSIERLVLEPHGWSYALASHWSNWSGFRGWTVRSVNFLYGTADVRALSPVTVAALWCLLGISILGGLVRFGLADFRHGLIAIVLIVWVTLDLLWQKELESQLNLTTVSFAGKTQHEKHLADIDDYVYRYIKRLKDEVLPVQPARIFLLHSSSRHNFRRLKSHFYLLPHNVYSFGNKPPSKGVHKGDYVLLLEGSKEVIFDAQAARLRWKEGKRSARAQRVDEDTMGALYLLKSGVKEEKTPAKAKQGRSKKKKGQRKKASRNG